jgi:hypothetical protein
MARAIEKLRTVGASLFGVDVPRIRETLRRAPWFVRTMREYGRRARGGPFPLELKHLYPILNDASDQAGSARGHYFHQDLWAARKIYAARPARHVDVGSRDDGFVAHVLTFMPVVVVDVRPLVSGTEGLTFQQADATEMTAFADGSIESLSSLHAVEHFGLGRYGDPVDPDACFRVMRALARVLAPGGRLYFAVPVGVEHVEFNAHRVFSPTTVIDAFERHGLELVSFSAVNDAGDMVADAKPIDFARAEYACGLFELTKPKRNANGAR